jgi:hypothetical protein
MGLWERLIGSGPAQETEAQRLLPELLASYREEVRLARQIRAHADRAPHQAGSQMLRAVAEEQDRLVQLLHDKITALGGTAGGDGGLVKEGKNHWARVVQDLKDNQALERHYNELAIYEDSNSPDVVTLLRTLQQGKSRLNALLRDIALRADPHAVD